MFAVERQSAIMTLLGERKTLLTQDAAIHFGVTEETIRRDLKVLERQGLIRRTHGGAILHDDAIIEPPLAIREGINIHGKDKIGAAAARLVKDGETVILDASTSALYVAKHLKNKHGITVITNAERIILELAECHDINLICTGGVLRHRSLSYTGRAAENVIGSYLADHLFFSCKGFSPTTGLTDSTEPESEIRKIMLTRAKHRTFLCDKTKIDRVGFSATASLDDINTLITDEDLPTGWDDMLAEHNVEIVIAK